MQSIAGPVLASAVWTDKKKKKKKLICSYRNVHTMKTGQSRLLGPDSSVFLNTALR